MTKQGFLKLAIVGALGVLASASMRADIIFNTSGTFGTDSVSGSADFNFTGSTLTLILTNKSDAGHIDQVLDGFSFSIRGGSLTNSSLGASSADGFVVCGPSNYPCSESTTDPNGGSSPYGWTSTGSGTYCLDAGGCGTYKPYGIVNNQTGDLFNTSPDCGSKHKGDLCNSQHNPYFLGPVTFTYTFTPDTPGGTIYVRNVQFDWGTSPGTTDGSCGRDVCSTTTTGGSVPEPTSILLFGTVLLGTAMSLKRRFAKQ